MEIHIIGGGITGCTLAYFLKKSAHVILYEKKKHLGGLCRTFYNLENIPYQHGIHILHTNEQWIVDLFSKFEHLEVTTQNVAMNPLYDFRYYDFPLSLKSLSTMPWHWKEAIELERQYTTGNTANNLKDLIINFYGKTAYKIFFKNYIQKLLCNSASRITEVNWFRNFLHPIDNIYRFYDDKYIYFPLNIGYNNIIDSLVEGVDVVFESEVTYKNLPQDDIVICTIRPDYFLLEEERLEFVQSSFDVDSAVYDTGKPDIIIFPNHVPFISMSQFGRYFNQDKNIIIKEYTGLDIGGIDTYPILTTKNKKEYHGLINRYSKDNLYFCGQQGSFKIMSMSDCIIQASKLSAKIKQGLNNGR